MMPNICIEKLDSDPDSDCEEAKTTIKRKVQSQITITSLSPYSLKELPSWSADSPGSIGSGSLNPESDGAVSESTPTGRTVIRPLRSQSDMKFSILSVGLNAFIKDPSTNKITKEEVAKHKSREDCWTIYDGKVFDITRYISSHPGGK
mmetsp:Transcript_29197/g.33423  ORF Transcript_29197/g.33423 Transcript_29197/m.33423 type:complete len:148 (-) Transcript_29197:255-698(-)